MQLSLPPLHALVAFEVAARLGSFQQAAQALHLTPSAVSHRIQLLEAHLGKPLFERRHRQIALTPDGQRYYATIHDALLRIHGITEALQAGPTRRLRLSVAPAIGSKWLMGRITQYQEQHPDIDFEFATATGLAPLWAGEADLGLKYGDEEWPGLDAWKLFDETLIPVCAPRYAARLAGLPDPQALRGARLLRHPLLSWAPWCAAAGLPAPEPDGPRYEDALLMLEAAVAGQGVALITSTLAASYLAEGSLVQPVPLACPDRGFYLVAPRALQDKPWALAFVRWLIASVRQPASPA